MVNSCLVNCVLTCDCHHGLGQEPGCVPSPGGRQGQQHGGAALGASTTSQVGKHPWAGSEMFLQRQQSLLVALGCVTEGLGCAEGFCSP